MFSANLLFGISSKELAEDINSAGKGRMLIQKITKEALLIKSNFDKNINLENLKKSSIEFNKIFSNLSTFDNKDIKEQLKRVRGLWEDFYKNIDLILKGSGDNKNFEYLEKNNMKLVDEIDRLVKLYVSHNKDREHLRLANDINLAGKQRMLTQRMAKDLLAINSGFEVKRHKKDFEKSKELFDRTLNGLLHGDKRLNLKGTNLPKIVNQLKVVQNEWNKTKPILKDALKGKDVKVAILKLDKILEEMDRAVTYYTQSINRQKQRIKLASILGNFMNKSKILKKRVNLSGRQRMLVQRMTKLALLIEEGIDKRENIKKLEKFSNLYDKTLKAFRDGDKDLGCIPTNNRDIREKISIVESAWRPFYKNIKKIIAQKDEDKSAIEYVVENNEKLLKLSDDLVKAYEKSNRAQNFLEKARVHVVNIAGRQRMLTQKMTKEKLLVIQGEDEYKKKLKNTIELFDSSLKNLTNGNLKENILKPTNEKIIKQLAVVNRIWNKLKPLYKKDKLTKNELNRIIKENPILLREMDKMVKMAEVEMEY
jgi:hypothetical protein